LEVTGGHRVRGQITYNQMVVDTTKPQHLDEVFHALADPTRRDIVARVMRQEYSVSGLARLYPMSFAAVQKHVAVLARAGVVSKERRGREQAVRGNIETVRQVSGLFDQLEEVWRDRIDRIGDLLAESTEGASS
jgi:DNA-binding transcriptional ArsR family regulator